MTDPKIFLVGVVYLAAIFGPKLGILDFSVIGVMLGIAILMPFNKVNIFCREYYIIILFYVVILIYSLINYAANENANIYMVARHIRAFLSTAFLAIFVMNVKLSPKQVLGILTAVLLLNAIIILAQVMAPQLQVLMADLFGFDKKFVPLRAFGLTSGYDTAGYYCLIGIMLSALHLINFKDDSFYHWVSLLIFSAAGLLTSRNVIALELILLSIIVYKFAIKGRLGLKIFSLLLSLIAAAVIYQYVYPLFLSSIHGPQNANLLRDYSDFSSSYNISEGTNLIKRHVFLPDSEIHLLFGNGENPASDIGYIKIIHMMGFSGLSLFIMYFAYIYMKMFRSFSISKKWRQQLGMRYLIILQYISILTILLILVANTKNLYFFARGYNELLTIMVFSVLLNLKIQWQEYNHYHRFEIPLISRTPR